MSGPSPVFTAGAGSDGTVLQPMAQAIEPGGFCMSTPGAVQFQATPQPRAQPWSLPAWPRLRKAMALSRPVPSEFTTERSTSSPVAQYMCGWMCERGPSPSKSSTTLGPSARRVVTIMILRAPFEAERSTSTSEELKVHSDGAASVKESLGSCSTRTLVAVMRRQPGEKCRPSTVFQTSTSLTQESTVLVMSRNAGLPAVPRLGARKRRASIPTWEMRPSQAYFCSEAPGGVTYLP